MKLSTRSRYGLRAMLAIAQNPDGGAMMSRGIAEKQGLPATYLEQLMLALRKARLVTATRGAKGGYVLARDPREITMAEIVEALDGPIDIANCGEGPSCCTQAEVCVLRGLFDEASKAVLNVFGSVTLAELADRQSALEATTANMYYI